MSRSISYLLRLTVIISPLLGSGILFTHDKISFPICHSEPFPCPADGRRIRCRLDCLLFYTTFFTIPVQLSQIPPFLGGIFVFEINWTYYTKQLCYNHTIEKLFHGVQGGVLFFDEAGSLVQIYEHDSFTKEAVDALVRHMENQPEKSTNSYSWTN